MKITNPKAWGVGRLWPNGFHVRRIFWGRLLARKEKRDDEVIRRVAISLAAPARKRKRA